MYARENQHSKIAILHRPGTFEIIANGWQFEFNEVDHASISGIRLMLPKHFPIETPVTLIYRERNFQIAIHGKIIRASRYTNASSPRTLGNYQIDIHFYLEDIETNALFFMALREYIDPFTWFGITSRSCDA